MKTIFVYYINYKNIKISKLKKDLLTNKLNRLINLMENDFSSNKNIYKCNLKYKYKSPQVIYIEFVELPSYNDEFFEIVSIHAFRESELCSNEPIDSGGLNKVKEILKSTFNKYIFYIDDSNDFYKKDIICLLSEVFFKIIMHHPLKNGNKRVATFILVYLLYHFGFYFKNTKGAFKDYSIHKSQVEKFVEEFQYCYNPENMTTRKEKDSKSIKEIYKWINRNIVIGLNFQYS